MCKSITDLQSLCRPFEESEDSYVFHSLDTNIPYLKDNEISSFDIIQRCHKNLSIYSALNLDVGHGALTSLKHIDFNIIVTETNLKFNSSMKVTMDILSTLELIKQLGQTFQVDDIIHQVKMFQDEMKNIQDSFNYFFDEKYEIMSIYAINSNDCFRIFLQVKAAVEESFLLPFQEVSRRPLSLNFIASLSAFKM